FRSTMRRGCAATYGSTRRTELHHRHELYEAAKVLPQQRPAAPYNAPIRIMLGPDRWGSVERLYHAALAQPVARPAVFLAEACEGDDELRREVESLLAQDAQGALTRGAVVAAAELVSDAGQSVLTGRGLGGYQILAPIGAGGMGEVYRARDTRLGRE